MLSVWEVRKVKREDKGVGEVCNQPNLDSCAVFVRGGLGLELGLRSGLRLS